MKKEDNYIEINRDAWNSKTDYHVESDFYNMQEFLDGKSSLNGIELALLGDVKGKSILHLQCHFGQDSISMARMGASVTGVDFSDKAISKAGEMAAVTNTDAKFICCDVYSLPEHLNEKFDVVFTSYGTIGWLPDLDKWAGVIKHFLKPGGQFVFAEFHPVVWMFDYNFEKIAYNYFKDEAIIETESGTYADNSAPIVNETVSWNHSIGEVMSSLLAQELEVTTFNEYDYSPYNCFKNMAEFEPGKFRIQQHENRLPMVYSIKAIKKTEHR